MLDRSDAFMTVAAEKLLIYALGRPLHTPDMSSVRDIVRAAGVPQGSFTNHFASKEVFALEALDLYYARSCKMMRETLGN